MEWVITVLVLAVALWVFAPHVAKWWERRKYK